MGKLRQFLQSKFNIQGIQTGVNTAPLGKAMLTIVGSAVGMKLNACFMAIFVIFLIWLVTAILRVPVNFL